MAAASRLSTSRNLTPLSRASWRPLFVSAAAAASLYVVAAAFEAGLIRLLQPSELELAWISDLVLAVASGVAVFLWLNLRAARTELDRREREKLSVDTQLAVAADIQRRLLPELPTGTRALTWAAALRPAGVIGGDFYDVIERGPNHWVVMVADVSGKGIPAAMALGSLRATFRALSNEAGGPGALLTMMSGSLHDQWRGAPYVTAVVLDVDLEAGSVTYSNAGHPTGLLAGPAGVTRLDSVGPPAGLLPGVRYAERATSLQAGDTCLLVTDGITEALGGDSSEALQHLLARPELRTESAQAICSRVMNLALAASGPVDVTDWHDDRTVLVFVVGADAGTRGQIGASPRPDDQPRAGAA
jgi:sigma-B regulation protein RsbU (phosphoserine phosphatase)